MKVKNGRSYNSKNVSSKSKRIPDNLPNNSSPNTIADGPTNMTLAELVEEIAKIMPDLLDDI